MTETEQEKNSQPCGEGEVFPESGRPTEDKYCETCGRDLNGLTHYEGVYHTHGPGGPTTKQFCAIPCLTKHAYNNTETVELPGGLSDE